MQNLSPTDPAGGSRGLAAFYLAIFVFAWGVGLAFALFGPWMVRAFGPVRLWNPLVFLAVWSPTLAAFAMALCFEGKAGLAAFVSRCFRWRVGLRWFLISTVGVAALALSARVVQAWTTHTPLPPIFAISDWPAFAWAGASMLVLDPGPIGEDPGWRGFALPRMLARFKPTTAAVLLGLIWTVWHLPAFFFSGMPQAQLPLPQFIVAMVSVTVLMSWVSINTGGAVIPAILMHWAFNRFSDLGPQGATFAAAAYFIAAVAVILATGGRLAPADPGREGVSQG